MIDFVAAFLFLLFSLQYTSSYLNKNKCYWCQTDINDVCIPISLNSCNNNNSSTEKYMPQEFET